MTADPPSRACPRFYLPDLPHPRVAERSCLLDPEQTRHLRKVLRRKEGDRVELFDGEGSLGKAVIVGFDGPRAMCRVEHVDFEPASQPQITVAAAVPKGGRPEDMIEQLCQVGADRFIPLRTARGVVDPRPQKLERMARQSVEAAKQCGRLHLMQVEDVTDLKDVLAEEADLRLIASTGGKHVGLPERLREAQSVQVLIGPEGGWTPEELSEAEVHDALRWVMGPLVMRIETAAPAAVAVLRYFAMSF